MARLALDRSRLSLAGLAVAAVATLAGACASFGADTGPGDPDGSTQGDASGIADGGVDASVDAIGIPPVPDGGRCPAGTGFGGTATQVTIQGGYNVESARFSADGSIGCFALYAIGAPKSSTALYTASRVAAGMYDAPTPLPGIIPSTMFDSSPALSADTNHLVFASSRTGLKLWSTERAAGASGFGQVTSLDLPAASPVRTQADTPYLLANGTLYFAAAGGTGDYALFRTTGGPPGYATNTATHLTVPSALPDTAPVVTEDEQEIFFASDRNGHALDLWMMQHVMTGSSSEFANEASLGGLSTAGIDYPVWVSPDACDLYFIRKVAEAGQLYVAHRR